MKVFPAFEKQPPQYHRQADLRRERSLVQPEALRRRGRRPPARRDLGGWPRGLGLGLPRHPPADRQLHQAGRPVAGGILAPCAKEIQYGGQIWALPLTADPNLGSSGTTDSSRGQGIKEPPKTFDDMNKMAQELTVVKGGQHPANGLLPWNVYGNANSMHHLGLGVRRQLLQPGNEHGDGERSAASWPRWSGWSPSPRSTTSPRLPPSPRPSAPATRQELPQWADLRPGQAGDAADGPVGDPGDQAVQPRA